MQLLQSITAPTVRAQNHKVLWDFPAILRIPLPTSFKIILPLSQLNKENGTLKPAEQMIPTSEGNRYV